MNYEQAIKYIRSVHNSGTTIGLERAKRVMELIGNPQNSYKIVHVAGTNGKGSTCNMIHDVLVSSGYKTGLFVSPHLEDFNERIQINKVPIGNDDLTRLANFVKDMTVDITTEGFGELTEFEIVTAIGFKYFEEQHIDILVLEVGMGGRYDTTNVVQDSLVSTITSISFDHMEYLGDTLEKIAYEKAGIIKEKSHVVIYPQSEKIEKVIEDEAHNKGSKVNKVDKKDIRLISSDLTGQQFEYLKKDVFNLPLVKINLLGEHQLYNALTSLRTLEVLKCLGYNIKDNDVLEGLANCRYGGRFEIINNKPLIIIDGAHNIDGIEKFTYTVKSMFEDKKIVLFYGMLKDKNPENVIGNLLQISKEIYTLSPHSYRAMSSFDIANLIKKYTNINVTSLNKIEEVKAVIEKKGNDEVYAFVGSLYLIGEIRTLLKNYKFN